MPSKRSNKLAALIPVLATVVALSAGQPASAAQPRPSITGFSPKSGGAGVSVQIFGNEFQGVNSVTFNGVSASFVVNSHSLITTNVPVGATTGRIRVARPGWSTTSATDFTVTSPGPAITGFLPTSGHVGDAVQISGTDFIGVDSVSFNGTAATTFTVNSAVLITAVVPGGATTGPIRVARDGASSTSTDDFTVTGPAITGFTPTSGHVGDQVQISGTDFIGVDSVSFSGTAATSFTVNSDVLITAVVPAGATTGPIAVARGGTSSTSGTDFTVIPAGPDLTLKVSDSADPVVADSTLTYTLTAQNVGGSPAATTTLVDTLPPEVIFKSATDGGTYDASSGAVTWNLGTLGAGATQTETLVIQPIHPAFPMTNSASVTTTSTDPGTPNTVTTDTEVDPQPGTHYVSVTDTKSTPFYRGLSLGDTVQWDFLGPSDHEITDSHGLGYLDTGLHSPVSYWSFTFDLSAELRTKDLDAFPLNLGKITVPPTVTPSTGLTTDPFLVVWALQQPPPNIVEDVQIKRPGGNWVHWRHRQSVLMQDQFVPDAGPGTYAFRSRIRNVSNHAVSRFGPPVMITVT